MHARRRGLTLIELMIVVSIITVLVAMLLPAIGGMLARSREFSCQFGLRGIATDFQMFANSDLAPDRGHDTGKTFSLQTFQEKKYGLNEFWRKTWGTSVEQVVLDTSNSSMVCASVRRPLMVDNRVADGNLDDLVSPIDAVSYGLNSRLFRRPDFIGDSPVLRPVNLNDSITIRGNVPLVVEVDGEDANSMGMDPFWIAPAVDPADAYGDGRYWFPSRRHQGKVNVAFIGGHVLSSDDPLSESSWDWAYSPRF